MQRATEDVVTIVDEASQRTLKLADRFRARMKEAFPAHRLIALEIQGGDSGGPD